MNMLNKNSTDPGEIGKFPNIIFLANFPIQSIQSLVKEKVECLF